MTVRVTDLTFSSFVGFPFQKHLPFDGRLALQGLAAVHRRHGLALPGKPGPSMSVSMLFVNRVHNLGFSALRLAVEFFPVSLGFISVIRGLRLQAETIFKVLLVKCYGEGW